MKRSPTGLCQDQLVLDVTAGLKLDPPDHWRLLQSEWSSACMQVHVDPQKVRGRSEFHIGAA